MRRIATPFDDRVFIVESDPSWPPPDFFTEAELERANQFRQRKRRDEWLLARAAAKQFALERGLCASARECMVERPSLRLPDRSPWFVSISHSDRFAAAAIDSRPIGVDIQMFRDLPESAAHLFLTEKETTVMSDLDLRFRILHFWVAKEAVFKRMGTASTLKQVPLRLIDVGSDGLVFDEVTTVVRADLVIGVTSPVDS